ncbi:MAG: SIR2 family protein [Crocinitomicaceae bacterium]
MSFKEEFYNKLDEFASSPFLFLGSGFSLKYINTENWEGLLRKYSGLMDKPFERYRSLADGNWPKVGSLIARDYHTHWFEAGDLEEERNNNLQEMVSFSSPLKVSVSTYLKNISKKPFEDNVQTDIELLKKAKINGIITTNYDLLCETIYPDFKVYKSQQELIFSPLQEIGEIYKIHGCCTEPNSLVITEEDYKDYNEKNAYLAAKLLTVFLEHPTIFMGYSISDKNVRNILSSIVKCLDQNQVNELSNRLFFVEYVSSHEGAPIIDKYEFEIGGAILPLTRIRAKEYTDILNVLSSLNQKFPAALLRKMKEHIYELVSTNDPTEKIAVVDFNIDTDLDKVDVVIGVGVSGKTDKSYETYSRFDIAEDVLYGNKDFEIKELISKTLPKLIKATTWTPVCKYYSQIDDKDSVDAKIKSAVNRPIEDWHNGNPYSYKVQTIRETYSSIDEVTTTNPPEKSVKIILLLEIEKLDLRVLEKFLKDNFNLTQDAQNSSYYMKLLCLYDRLKNE